MKCNQIQGWSNRGPRGLAAPYCKKFCPTNFWVFVSLWTKIKKNKNKKKHQYKLFFAKITKAIFFNKIMSPSNYLLRLHIFYPGCSGLSSISTQYFLFYSFASENLGLVKSWIESFKLMLVTVFVLLRLKGLVKGTRDCDVIQKSNKSIHLRAD